MFESVGAFMARFLLPVLVGICLGVASYRFGKGRKDREKKGEGGTQRFPSPEQLNTKRKPSAVQRDSHTGNQGDNQVRGQKGRETSAIDARRQCWEAYQEAFYEKEVSRRLRNVFSQDALLYSLSKLFGIAHYDLEKYGWDNGRDRIEYVVNQEIRNALKQHIGSFQGNKLPKLPSKSDVPVDISQQQYYRQRGFTEEGNNPGREKKLQEELARLKKEQEDSINGRQGAFYRKLWKNSSALLEELMEYGMKLKGAMGEEESSASQENLRQQFISLAGRLKALMEENGIRFLFRDEASEKDKLEYFKVVERGESIPAVIRVNDGYVYYMGQEEQGAAATDLV